MENKYIYARFFLSIFHDLPIREQKILSKRYGLNDTTHTYEEIGREYGVTRERIRQIEAKAIKKLDNALNNSLSN